MYTNFLEFSTIGPDPDDSAKFAPHKQRKGLFFGGVKNCLHGVAKLAEWFLRGEGEIIFFCLKPYKRLLESADFPSEKCQ